MLVTGKIEQVVAEAVADCILLSVPNLSTFHMWEVHSQWAQQEPSWKPLSKP